jgi:cell division protein FtsZ
MTINLSVPATHELKPRITVFGVGGAGGNAVNNMITSHLEGVEFVVANTDAQALAQSLTERRIQLGTSLTGGLGAGARPDIGRQATEEALEAIEDHLQGCNMVFITCGMGGGTGTGGAPIIARAAREHGVLTVGVATKPFHFEGKHRMRIAEAGIEEMQQVVDTLIVIPNQNLFRVATEKTTFADAFKMADDVLYSGVRGVTDLMVMPGLINLDFADVRSVMMEMGKAMMGTGEAEGEKRSLDAAEAAINNPLLDDVSLKGARGVLVNITGGPDMTLFEVDEACNHIRDQVDPEANIIFGSTFDEGLAGRIRVSVVATGIDDEGAVPSAALSGAERVSVRVRPASAGTGNDDRAVAAPPPPAAEPAAAEAVAPVRLFATASAAASVPARAAEPPSPRLVAAEAEPERVESVLIGRRATDREASAVPPGEPVAAVGGSAEAGQDAARPRLFDWMKRAGRGQDAPAQSTQAPASEPAPERVPEPALEPAPFAQPRREDDLLDIPAFLRRQSN